jgi:hypothetical protein
MYFPLQLGKLHKTSDSTTDLRSSNQTTDGMSPQHPNRCGEFKHRETPFDYLSLMYTIKKCNLDKPPIMLRTKHQYSIEKPQEKYSTP